MNKTLKYRIIQRYGSQADFAQALNLAESEVSRVVRGRRTLPSGVQKVWAEALGCKVEEVFQQTQQEERF